MKFEYTLNTNGQGLWSDVAKEVKVTELECDWSEDDVGTWGELRVHFDTKSWDVNDDGLIYTDKEFLDELRGYLELNGLDDSDVHYSEQGMQGDDYVSLDVGSKFITSWTLTEWFASGLPGK